MSGGTSVPAVTSETSSPSATPIRVRPPWVNVTSFMVVVLRRAFGTLWLIAAPA
jgi:hypothetical protein